MSDLTTQEWADKLARGDGQGLVPVDVAYALWEAGYTAFEPQPTKGKTHVMVRLKS